MKKIIVLIVASLLWLGGSGFGPSGQAQDCYEVIEKVLQPFISDSHGDTYLKYSNRLIIDGKFNEPMTHEVLTKGGKSSFKNEALSIYEYGGKQVSILKDRKMILIQNVLKKAPLKNTVNPAEMFAKDSLSKYYSKIVCGIKSDGIGYIDMDIKKEYTERLPYYKITIEYKPQGMKYQRCIMHLRKASGGEEVQEIVEIIQFSNHPKHAGFPENIMNTVYVNGKLKPEYKGYQVKDLSTKAK